MEWVNKLYEETNRLCKKNNIKDGYAIFYSPVHMNPDIMIIGYNPGGGEEDSVESEVDVPKGVPKHHDYFPIEPEDDYLMARNMRKIFEGTGIIEKLRNSVKFNLIFFRSKNIKELKIDEPLKKFCEDKTKEIIDNLKPKLILAEGFGTYEELLRLTNGNNEENQYFPDNNDKQKCISSIGKTGNGIRMIGIIHPSSGRGVTDEMRIKIGKDIKVELNN